MKDREQRRLLHIWLEKGLETAWAAQEHGQRLEVRGVAMSAQAEDPEYYERLLGRVKEYQAAWESIKVCIQDALEMLETEAVIPDVYLCMEETLRRSRIAATDRPSLGEILYEIGSAVEVQTLRSSARYMLSVFLKLHEAQLPACL